MKKGTVVRVVWRDAEASAEWTDEEDLDDHTNLACETVGFLVRSPTKKAPVYVIAATRSKGSDGKFQYNAIQKIPAEWVTEAKTYEQ